MIGLMDCNNFFVSCERLFRPDLQTKPVAVLSSNDGCIVSRSQEVKDLDIPMGIPYFQVKDICTQAGVTLFSSNFTLYRDLSSRIMQTLAREVGMCEIYSIDEAFFEVPANITEHEVRAVREHIVKNIGLPVSIGVAHTKTRAKEASKIAKKGNGVCLLTHDLWSASIDATACSSVWGMGRNMVAKLKEIGVSTVKEFLELDRSVIQARFGIVGVRIYLELHGVAAYPLRANSTDVRQSIMSSQSFEKSTKNLHELESAIGYHVSNAAQKLREKGLLATSLRVVIQASRHGDFFLHHGSSEVALPMPTAETSALLSQALVQTRNIFELEVPYKKAGVVLSGLMPVSYLSGSLFANPVSESEQKKDLTTIVDSLNQRFGRNMVRSGVLLRNGVRASAKLRSKEYTTSWKDIPSVQAA